MNGSFWNAITGAKSHQSAIDATGNNIANVNTVGYKGSRTEFASLFSETLNVNQQTLSSDRGMGTRVQATATDMRAGTYQATDSPFDAAIHGDGWFGVIGTNPYDAKQVAYTRDGTFSRDRDSMLVNQSGNYVLGSTYGNLIEENGQWKIDPSVETGGLKALATQGPIRVPAAITHPPVGTSEATLMANLNGESIIQSRRADEARDLAAVVDAEGEALGLSEGEGVLIAAGEEPVGFDNGAITLTRTLTPSGADSFSATINDQAITAQWEAGADNSTIATAIAEAINGVEGVSASASGDQLILSSADRLSIDQSSDPGVLGSLSAGVVRYGDTQTVGELRGQIENIVQGRYADAKATYRHDGRLSLSGTEAGGLQVREIDATASGLLEMLAPLALNTDSKAFNEAYVQTGQNAVSQEGEALNLFTDLTLAQPVSDKSNAKWEAKARLEKSITAQNSSDLKDLILRSEPLDLKGGENLWFNAGKPAADIEGQKGYSLKLADDSANGTPATVSFTLDGQSFSVTADDGANLNAIASAVATELGAAGYESRQSGSELVILARGENMQVADVTTSMSELSNDDMTLGRITYTPGMDLEAFSQKLSAIGAPVGVEAALDGGRLSLKNSGTTDQVARFLSGENTPEDFQVIFSGLSGAIAAGESSDESRFGAREILGTSGTQSVAFDDAGRVAAGTKLTLDNGGTPLEVGLDLTNWDSDNGFAQLEQNGVHEGGLTGYDINREGQIVGTFSNGRSNVLGQLAVYHFRNDQGLERISENLFKESENSGDPFFWVDENGRFSPGALIEGRTLEGSNVQSAVALTELIVYQRSYEGSAKAITTSDQLIQNAIQMKR
jgi:flagellar hook-basal body protein